MPGDPNAPRVATPRVLGGQIWSPRSKREEPTPEEIMNLIATDLSPKAVGALSTLIEELGGTRPKIPRNPLTKDHVIDTVVSHGPLPYPHLKDMLTRQGYNVYNLRALLASMKGRIVKTDQGWAASR